jgi:hypothetical protein
MNANTSTLTETPEISLVPEPSDNPQGLLADTDLERFGGLAAKATHDWKTCPNTPTAARDCCVGGTVG